MTHHLMKNFWTEVHLKGGYDLVASPHIARQHLWETSGHLDFYADGMFNAVDIEGDLYRLKPMNCPFHIKIYQDRLRSYRELPEVLDLIEETLGAFGFTDYEVNLSTRPEKSV